MNPSPVYKKKMEKKNTKIYLQGSMYQALPPVVYSHLKMAEAKKKGQTSDKTHNTGSNSNSNIHEI